MLNIIIFCSLVATFGVALANAYHMPILGYIISVVSVCILFFVGVIMGIFIFAENLEVLKTYHICDSESKVKLTLKLGCLGYTINIPVTEQNCPACQEKRVEKDNIGKS